MLHQEKFANTQHIEKIFIITSIIFDECSLYYIYEKKFQRSIQYNFIVHHENRLIKFSIVA